MGCALGSDMSFDSALQSGRAEGSEVEWGCRLSFTEDIGCVSVLGIGPFVASHGRALSSSGAFSCIPQLGITRNCSVFRVGEFPDFTFGESFRICFIFG